MAMSSTPARPPSLSSVPIHSSLADRLPIGPPGPLAYEREYRHLGVDVGAAGRFFVDIRKYRNNQMNDDPKHETRTAENEGYFPLVRAIRLAARGDKGIETGPKDPTLIVRQPQDELPGTLVRMSDAIEFVSKQRLYDAYTGKGSPEDIALTLRLAVRFGLVAADTTSLQNYCDKYIGLDCSAFVCNYANAALGKNYDKSSKGATTFREPASARRARMLDIRALDVLAWANTNHVAIVQAVYYNANPAAAPAADLASLECTVVESNMSKGLNDSTYRVVSVDARSIFTVMRPDGSQHRVYILPLP
jgi:hypothetical protein